MHHLEYLLQNFINFSLLRKIVIWLGTNDHNILFGMIQINNKDMRNEETEEQLNIYNMVEGVQQVQKTLID